MLTLSKFPNAAAVLNETTETRFPNAFRVLAEIEMEALLAHYDAQRKAVLSSRAA